MNKTLKGIKAKLAALEQRERWMVLLAGLVIFYYLVNVLLIEPVVKKNKQVIGSIAETEQAIAALGIQLTQLKAVPANQQAVRYQQQVAALQKKIEQQQLDMADIEAGLVTPQKMTAVLKGLMHVHANIRLVRMQTLKPIPYIPSSSADASTQETKDAGLYKHAFSITLEGRYLDLIYYADALQQLPNSALWEKAVLNTKEYPVNELTLHLYTLSMDKTWLSI